MAGTSSWAKQRGDEMQSENATMDKTRRAFILTTSQAVPKHAANGRIAVSMEEWQRRGNGAIS